MYVLTALTVSSTHCCQLASHHDSNISLFKPIFVREKLMQFLWKNEESTGGLAS
jgi:hypothetical protein